jgi:hypothetical protein
MHAEDSPWEPLHVSRGFRKEDNTLTVFPQQLFAVNSLADQRPGHYRCAGEYGIEIIVVPAGDS